MGVEQTLLLDNINILISNLLHKGDKLWDYGFDHFYTYFSTCDCEDCITLKKYDKVISFYQNKRNKIKELTDIQTKTLIKKTIKDKDKYL